MYGKWKNTKLLRIYDNNALEIQCHEFRSTTKGHYKYNAVQMYNPFISKFIRTLLLKHSFLSLLDKKY